MSGQTRERAPADWYRWQDGDLLLSLRVLPRAKRDELVGPAGEYFKVRITAPPVEGKANDHLCRYLARLFGVPRSQIEFLAGRQARLKRLRIRAPSRLPEAIPCD
ncbi:MAG: DUF167 family protein [Pseudomonadota bacterium]|nr:DUF167 family protein [Pseudomonadota bacterium]